jgi:hypothetical protein
MNSCQSSPAGTPATFLCPSAAMLLLIHFISELSTFQRPNS